MKKKRSSHETKLWREEEEKQNVLWLPITIIALKRHN